MKEFGSVANIQRAGLEKIEQRYFAEECGENSKPTRGFDTAVTSWRAR